MTVKAYRLKTINRYPRVKVSCEIAVNENVSAGAMDDKDSRFLPALANANQ